MKKEFDFYKIGKRMPYQTPDNFFDQMEANIWKEVKGDLLDKGDKTELKGLEDMSFKIKETSSAPDVAVNPKRKSNRLRILVGALSIAASITLLLILNPRHSQTPQQQTDGLALVEKAFSNLTLDDQAYMLQVYQEDVFINE